MALRRLGAALLTLALVVGGLVALVSFLGARDAPTFGDRQTAGPGRAFRDQGARHLRRGQARPRYVSDPPTSGAHVPRAIRRDGEPLDSDQLLHALELGNVVLVYSDTRLDAGVRALQRDVAGPFTTALAATGQAVIRSRRPSIDGTGVTAIAWRHSLRVMSPTDPALREFLEFWLGRGADSS